MLFEDVGFVFVYDFLVDEYDWYFVGKDGFFVVLCNDFIDLMIWDK